MGLFEIGSPELFAQVGLELDLPEKLGLQA
jgi:hypothetical protein